MDMPSFNNQPSPSDPEVKDWFNTIDAGTPLPQPQPQPKGPNLKKRLVVGILVVLFVFGATAGVLSALGVNLLSTAPACLTKDDYRALTDSTADEQLSPQSFYTASFDFTNGTSDYTEGSKENAESLAKKIGEFYQSYGSKRSIVVTVSSDATEGDKVDAGAKRIQVLKDLLVGNGVDESAIQAIKPVSVDSSSELSGDSEALSSAKAYVNVASVAGCQ